MAQPKLGNFDFVSSLASREPASATLDPQERMKEIEQELVGLAEEEKRVKSEFSGRQAERAKKGEALLADTFARASEADKAIGAAGLAGAINRMQSGESLKGKTFRDLVEEGGLDTADIPEKKMSTGELVTRLSMALVPGLAGFAVGKIAGAANPYAIGAAGAEAGMKGLEALGQLEKEKRERQEKIQLSKIMAAREEAKDIRRFEREMAIAPYKAQERAKSYEMAIRAALGRPALEAALGEERVAPDLANIQKTREQLLREQADLRKQEREAKTEEEKIRLKAELDAKNERLKATKELGDPDIGGGFVMNPQKKWTAKDREQAQKIVAGYAGHGQSIDELIATIKEVGRSGAIPLSADRAKLIQASQKYIDSYRGWVGTGANYTDKEMQLAKSVGADLKDGTIDILKLVWDPEQIIDRLETLRDSVRKTAGSKVSVYGAVDTMQRQQKAAPRPEQKSQLMSDEQKARLNELRKKYGK